MVSRHLEGNDVEERRQAFALAYRLPADSTWGFILKEMSRVDYDDFHYWYPDEVTGLDELFRVTADQRRRILALPCGLGPDATWDQIYQEWKGQYRYPTLVGKIGL